MRNVLANARYWFAGIVTALIGVGLARGIAPSLDGVVRPLLTAAGQLLALGGLFIICLGVRRRIKTVPPAGAPSVPHSP